MERIVRYVDASRSQSQVSIGTPQSETLVIRWLAGRLLTVWVSLMRTRPSVLTDFRQSPDYGVTRRGTIFNFLKQGLTEDGYHDFVAAAVCSLSERVLSASSFRESDCAAMALVLHEWIGRPIGHWRAFYPGEDGDEDEAFVDVHAVVKFSTACDLWLDVDSIHLVKPDTLPVPKETSRVAVVDASPARVAQAFTMADDLSIGSTALTRGADQCYQYPKEE